MLSSTSSSDSSKSGLRIALQTLIAGLLLSCAVTLLYQWFVYVAMANLNGRSSSQIEYLNIPVELSSVFS